jgi:hypothetical protein
VSNFKLWIQEQHTDDDRQSELACTVRDEYLACQDSFDVAHSDVEAGRIERTREDERDTLTPKQNETITDNETDTEGESRREAVQKATSKQARMNRELRKLDSSSNPTSMDKQTVIEMDVEGEEVAKEVHFVFLAQSDHEVPETINQALYGPDKAKWMESAASKIMNFISRKCWKKVPQKKPQSLN